MSTDSAGPLLVAVADDPARGARLAEAVGKEGGYRARAFRRAWVPPPAPVDERTLVVLVAATDQGIPEEVERRVGELSDMAAYFDRPPGGAGSVTYPGCDPLDAAALLATFSNPISGMEDEFEAWYDGVHIPELCRVVGFRGALRLWRTSTVGPGSSHRSLAFYGVDSDRVEESAEALMWVLTEERAEAEAAGRPPLVTRATTLAPDAEPNWMAARD